MQRHIQDIAVGDEPAPIAFGPFTLRHMVQWLAANHDFHEIHYDRDLARAQGLPDVVVPGPFKLGLMGRLLMDWVGPRGRILRLKVRYTGLDVPGTVLRCRGAVTAVRPAAGEADLELAVVNEQGVTTATGAATVWLPARP